ncbi:MAG: hypothetical protein QOG72_2412 [Sphingomonadales bacterium]|jgi:hypothetical protein|nr:hypothetical protein [Sphingomonadales bacterium]
MRSQLRWWVDVADNGRVHFNGTLDPADFLSIDFDRVERAMFAMPVEQASDFLLNVETLFRHGEEQAERAAKAA